MEDDSDVSQDVPPEVVEQKKVLVVAHLEFDQIDEFEPNPPFQVIDAILENVFKSKHGNMF